MSEVKTNNEIPNFSVNNMALVHDILYSYAVEKK